MNRRIATWEHKRGTIILAVVQGTYLVHAQKFHSLPMLETLDISGHDPVALMRRALRWVSY